ncbi:hypothetical protein K1719_043259 [Acacia pycnantha]|nr:hypothetical protein K1719_043259 [Acacia pycnantha]
MSGVEKLSTTTKTPADFLKSIRGRPVVVKLNSGVDYRGILACLDGYMNIAMEQTEEYVNGQLKNKYGDAFIRGNNVLYISTSKRTLADGAYEIFSFSDSERLSSGVCIFGPSENSVGR